MPDNIGQIPGAAAQAYGDHAALTFEGRSFSFTELNHLIEQAAV